MTDSEFCLTVIGHKTRKELYREMDDRGGVPKEALEVFNETAGLLGEVISRAPHSYKFYELGEVNKILLADGTPLGKLVDRVFELYLFKIEDVRMTEDQPPILTGPVRHYDLHCNRIGAPLEQKVTVSMKHTPTQKTENCLMCL